MVFGIKVDLRGAICISSGLLKDKEDDGEASKSRSAICKEEEEVHVAAAEGWCWRRSRGGRVGVKINENICSQLSVNAVMFSRKMGCWRIKSLSIVE